jgi:hypothetical protein
VEVVRRGDAEVVRVRLWDKPRTLEMLFRYLRFYRHSLDHVGSIEICWKHEFEVPSTRPAGWRPNPAWRMSLVAVPTD